MDKILNLNHKSSLKGTWITVFNKLTIEKALKGATQLEFQAGKPDQSNHTEMKAYPSKLVKRWS